MELRRYLHVIRQHILLMIVTTALGAGIGLVTVTHNVAMYSASAQIYVGSRQLAQNPQLLTVNAQLDQVLGSYSEMIASPVIVQRAVKFFKVDRPRNEAKNVTALVIPNTNIIKLTVIDTDPAMAKFLADGIADVFVNLVRDYDPEVATPGTTPTEPAYVFQPAQRPDSPIPSGRARTAVLGAVFGFIAAFLLVLLIDYLSVTIKNTDEVEHRLELTVLGIVPKFRAIPSVKTRRIIATSGENHG